MSDFLTYPACMYFNSFRNEKIRNNAASMKFDLLKFDTFSYPIDY